MLVPFPPLPLQTPHSREVYVLKAFLLLIYIFHGSRDFRDPPALLRYQRHQNFSEQEKNACFSPTDELPAKGVVKGRLTKRTFGFQISSLV